MPVHSREQMEACLRIRRQSFIIEKHVPEAIEVDALDLPGSDCRHYLILSRGEPAGTFRLRPTDPDSLQIQRFCFLPCFRSRHLGTRTIPFIEEEAGRMGYSRLVLDAQISALSFYRKCGFREISDFFEEAGILHKKMEKYLRVS